MGYQLGGDNISVLQSDNRSYQLPADIADELIYWEHNPTGGETARFQSQRAHAHRGSRLLFR